MNKHENDMFKNSLGYDEGYDEYLWYRDHPKEAQKEREEEYDEWQKQAIMDDKAQ